jgi:hypothetical protein
MTREEFKRWLSAASDSQYPWREEESYRLSDRGLLYYRGDVKGTYLEILKDGRIEAGQYTGKSPLDMDAYSAPIVRRQYGNFAKACEVAAVVAGVQFQDFIAQGEGQAQDQTPADEAQDQGMTMY